MRRAIVNVATGPYLKGQARLLEAVTPLRAGANFHYWRKEPDGCPPHSDVPYAFKAFALKQVAEHATQPADVLLWCDACILPIRSLEPLWERIERDGYWISNNGWNNYEWCADSAYPDLFPSFNIYAVPPTAHRHARAVNREIPHVVATAFGLSLKHPTGRAIFDEYYRLASETRAFCGPWKNSAHADWNLGQPIDRTIVAPCGPPDVRGHRHDQTALSVLAWRNGCTLTNAPEIFAYKGGEAEQTIILADGAY